MSMLNMLLASGGISELKTGFSGNCLTGIGNWVGINTSGFNYQQYFCDRDSGSTYNSGWQTVSKQGIFSGNARDTYSGETGINVSGNMLQSYYLSASGWVTFNLATKTFSGSTLTSGNVYNLETSGGLLRVANYDYGWHYSPYISLT